MSARTISITPVLNGFVVQIGCQTVVKEGLPALLAELSRYYQSPDKVEEEYLENAVNKLGLQVQPAPERLNRPVEPETVRRISLEEMQAIERNVERHPIEAYR